MTSSLFPFPVFLILLLPGWRHVLRVAPVRAIMLFALYEERGGSNIKVTKWQKSAYLCGLSLFLPKSEVT